MASAYYAKTERGILYHNLLKITWIQTSTQPCSDHYALE